MAEISHTFVEQTTNQTHTGTLPGQTFEERDGIAEHLSTLDESLRRSQTDIYEFGRMAERLSQFVNGIIERREAALDERVRVKSSTTNSSDFVSCSDFAFW